MPKLYFGSRGGVYYKKKGKKVYVNSSHFGEEFESGKWYCGDEKNYPYNNGEFPEGQDNCLNPTTCKFTDKETENKNKKRLVEEEILQKDKIMSIKLNLQQKFPLIYNEIFFCIQRV